MSAAIAKDRHLPDSWGSVSATYATTAIIVTRPASEALISWVDEISPFNAPNVDIFDDGCGSGVVSKALSSRFSHAPILAGDLSPGMVELVEKQNMPNVRTKVLDAVNLHSLEDNLFTHVLSTFMVQFTPAPLEALREMNRVTRSGGTLGLAVWGNSIIYEPWIDACRQFESGYMYPHAWSPDWEQENELIAYIGQAGFKEIQIKTLELKWNFNGPEDLYDFFLKSKHPEFERAIQPWKEGGRYDSIEAEYKRIVEDKYGGARDFAMKALLFVARK